MPIRRGAVQRKPALTRQAGKRNGNRLRLGVPAALVMTHRTCRCVIEDVSTTGARIQVEEPLGQGRMAMLNFHELRLYGTVIWCREGKCGIRFERTLTQGGHGRLPVDCATPESLCPPVPGKRRARLVDGNRRLAASPPP